MEKLFFDLQRDGHRPIRKSQDSLSKSINYNGKKLCQNLDAHASLHKVNSETHTNGRFCSNNSIEVKRENSNTIGKDSIINSNGTPLTFVVQVPSSIVDDFKKNVSSSDFLNILSKCSSKQSFKIKKKKGISSLFQNWFKRKKNNVPPSLDALLSKNIKFMKFLNEPNQNDKNFCQRSDENSMDQKLVSKNDFLTENAIDLKLTKADNNSIVRQNSVFPMNFNSNHEIHGPVKSNLIVQHEMSPESNINLCTHRIKITNKPLSSCNSQSSSKVTIERIEYEEKELEKCILDKLQSENHLMKNFIEKLLKSTENLDNLEILKIFVEILHEEKLRKKTFCCMDHSSTKLSDDKKSNFLHNFLQQLLIDLQSKALKNVDKNIRQVSYIQLDQY